MSEQQQALKCAQCDRTRINRDEIRDMHLFIGYVEQARQLAVDKNLPQSWRDALDEALVKIKATPKYQAYIDARQ